MNSMNGGKGYAATGPTGQPSKLGSTGYSHVQNKVFTPEQMDLFKQMFGQVSQDSFTSKLAGGDQETFNQIESPALQQFSELQGGIASRFSGMGGTGARKSSGFQNAASSASSNFAQALQSQRLGLQQNAIQQLHQMSQGLLSNRPYEDIYIQDKQKKPSFWEQLAGGFGQALGSAPSFFM